MSVNVEPVISLGSCQPTPPSSIEVVVLVLVVVVVVVVVLVVVVVIVAVADDAVTVAARLVAACVPALAAPLCLASSCALVYSLVFVATPFSLLLFQPFWNVQMH